MIWALLAGALVTALPGFAADDLAALSDEFDNAATLASFQRIHQFEGWGTGANKLETFNIHTTTPGRMVMVPHTSSWYQEYVGELTFKEVTGDFVVTTQVIPRNRARTGAPTGQFSLAGIMVRADSGLRTGAAGWQAGRQNYVFLSMGAANQPGTYQFEVKTTVNSVSTLAISDAAVSQAEIQVARLGNAMIMLRRDEGGEWIIHQRYQRENFPATLQVGLTVYTDWGGLQAVYPFGQEVQHNAAYATGQNPGLHAEFEYLRYRRPVVPAHLAGRDFTNPAQVSDAELLSFLGATASAPPVAPAITTDPIGQSALAGTNLTLTASASGSPAPAFQWQRSGTNLVGETGSALVLISVLPSQAGEYRVIASNSAGSVTSQVAVVSVFVSRFNPMVPADTASLPTEGFPLRVLAEQGRSFAIQWSSNLTDWFHLTDLTGEGEERTIMDIAATGAERRFYRMISP